MTIKVSGNIVHITVGTDTRVMTLEQYNRHCRDPQFDAAMKVGALPADVVSLTTAVAAVAALPAAL